MCRLAYLPRPFTGFSAWFRQLEDSCGGDGTGLAIGTKAIKSVHLTAEASALEAARILMTAKKGKKRQLPILWHTRRTSIGGTVDQLCHPFACDGGWLVHNGHWASMAAKASRKESDTLLFSRIVDEQGFAGACLDACPPGVWLHMTHDGRLAIWKNGGQLWRRDDGVIGSEPWGIGMRWERVPDGLHEHGEDGMGDPSVTPNDLFSEFCKNGLAIGCKMD